jgi:hypothetical protein
MPAGGIVTLIADSSRRRRAPKMDVVKGWSVRSEGNASTTLSSSCAAGHTWLLAEDGRSQSLLQVKREREALQSDCNIEALENSRPVAQIGSRNA